MTPLEVKERIDMQSLTQHHNILVRAINALAGSVTSTGTTILIEADTYATVSGVYMLGQPNLTVFLHPTIVPDGGTVVVTDISGAGGTLSGVGLLANLPGGVLKIPDYGSVWLFWASQINKWIMV